MGLPDDWEDKDRWTLKYIDDGLSDEIICNINAVCHITQAKEEKFLHARKSEHYLRITMQNSQKIGMKINAAKTKMICVTVAKNSLVNSFINLPDKTQITGSETLKMLGFVFGRRPNAQAHVQHISVKFYSKLWILRHMLKANVTQTDLVAIYTSYIRPVIEYCNVVYQCLLTGDQCERVENLQRMALKLIFGRKCSYAEALRKAGVESLSQRRKKPFEKFAFKIRNFPRFSACWLKENDKSGRLLRASEKYTIKKSCLLYTSPSPRDRQKSRMPSSA